MRRFDLERLAISQDVVQRIFSQLREAVGDGADRTGVYAIPPPDTFGKRRGDTAAVAQEIVLSNRGSPIEAFVPEWTRLSALELIEMLSERLDSRSNPSTTQAVVAAINRLASQGSLTERAEKVIELSLKRLASASDPQKGARQP